MKKFNKFATAGTLLLAGTMGFAGCSSDDELANVNPSYDGKSVKAQFSINIPANTTQSRMTTGEAQETTGAFLGMTGIKLVPMQFGSAETADDAATKVWKTVGLDDITAWDNGNIHAKVYNNVQFDLGTNRMLFYGKAKHTTTETGLDMTEGATVGLTKFNLVTPYVSTNVAAIQTYLLSVVNGVDAALTAQASVGVIAELQKAYRGEVGTDYKVIAGSSQKIQAMMQSLYTKVAAAQTADAANTVAYQAVLDAIATYFDTATFAFKTDATGFAAGADNYPACVNIPQGAVAVQFVTASGAFTYTTSDINVPTSGFNMTDVANYRKPSSLYYFVNSEVGTKDETWLVDNIATQTDWTNVVAQYPDKEVKSTTKSMVLTDKVQYGVAALKTLINAAGANLKDESGADITFGTNFKVTGILVGDQQDVNWKFEPTEIAGNYVVYDGIFSEGATVSPALSTTGTLTGNFTLLLQNWGDNTVKVAIEIENNAADFYGKDHMLISKGTKFYLIGELKKDANTNASTAAQHVFQQDFMTTATFTVSSLKNAYSVVPDLRSPKLEFGLAVDLEWQSGMSFDVTLD